MPCIAITGGTGHLGQHVVPLLINKGYRVRLLVRKELPVFFKHLEGLEPVVGSLEDRDSLNSLLNGADAVIHAAAYIAVGRGKREDIFKVNVEATQRLYELSSGLGLKRFVHISSVHAYRPFPTHELLDERRPLNFSGGLYDQSKAAAHDYLRNQSKAGDSMEVVVLSPSSMLGPPDYKPSLLGNALWRMAHGKVPALFPGGFDFCDIRDVAQATVQAIERAAPGSEYLLAGKWYSMHDLAAVLMDLAGSQKRPKALPFWVGEWTVPLVELGGRLAGKAPVFSKEALHILKHSPRRISSEKANKELGYSCRPLEESLGDLVEWWKQEQIWKR